MDLQNESLVARTHQLANYQEIERNFWSAQRADESLAAVANRRIAELNRERDALQAEVAALREERHSTNEALDDAAKALRADRDRFETLRALCDAAEHVGIVSGGWFTVEAVRRAAAGVPLPKPDGIARRIAPVQCLRDEDEFGLRRSYRVPHDLPGSGGQR
jgi:aminopeptidase N